MANELYTIQKSTITPLFDQIRRITETEDAMTFEGATGSLMNVVPGGGGDDTLNALVDRSITEISNNAEKIGNYAFYNCSSLTTADFPAATSISAQAFYNCSSLTTADFPAATSIDTSAFYNCSSLTTADFPAATSISNSAFRGCSSLTTADFPAATSIGSSAFYNCSSLTTADFPAATSIGAQAFYNCSSLTTTDFPAATSIGSYALSNCYNLTALILRSETMCSLSNMNAFDNCYHIHGTVNSDYNPDGLSDGYFYVPSALVDSYKVATNWNYFTARFRALEDYTVDGTITGELDPDKI